MYLQHMNNSVIIILFVLLLVAIMLWTIRSRRKERPVNVSSPAEAPYEEHRPGTERENDKLVLVDNIAESDMERVLDDFCKMYNKDRIRVRARLFKARTSVACITFPCDIDLELLCFLVNHINYPTGFDRSFRVTGWVTTRLTDTWITEETAGKKAMLYVPDVDTEYDQVLMTTQDNVSYNLSFAASKAKLLPGPGQAFRTPPIDAGTLVNYPFADFQ